MKIDFKKPEEFPNYSKSRLCQKKTSSKKIVPTETTQENFKTI